VSSFSNWFQVSGEKYQINSINIYRDLYPEIIEKIDANEEAFEILKWINRKIFEAYKSLSQPKALQTGALNNCKGRWYEFMATRCLTEISIQIYEETERCIAIFAMPSSTIAYKKSGAISAKFFEIFSPKEFDLGGDMAPIKKYLHNAFFSSPDYIVAVIDEEEYIPDIQYLLNQQKNEPESLALFNYVKGKLKARQIKAAISIKTENRPDRLYQPSFEAAMIKAIASRSNQNWKYYMIAGLIKPVELYLFGKAIAPHSISIDLETRLVDQTFTYQTKDDLAHLIEKALEVISEEN